MIKQAAIKDGRTLRLEVVGGVNDSERVVLQGIVTILACVLEDNRLLRPFAELLVYMMETLNRLR